MSQMGPRGVYEAGIARVWKCPRDVLGIEYLVGYNLSYRTWLSRFAIIHALYKSLQGMIWKISDRHICSTNIHYAIMTIYCILPYSSSQSLAQYQSDLDE